MDTAELRSFVIVAELASFSRAATRLGVPQSTLSRHIAKLEDELGGRLFYRHGRGVSLTDTGRRLQGTVQPVVEQLDKVCNAIAAQREEPSGSLRFAVTSTTGRSLAASVVVAFQKRCPQVHLHLVEAFGGTMFNWLETGWVDVGIYYQDVYSDDPISAKLLKDDQFLIGLPELVPEVDPVPLKEIDQSRLVLYGRGAGRRAIDGSFKANDVALNVPLVVESFATIIRLIQKNQLLSILPMGAVFREIADGRLVARKIAPPADLNMLLVARTASGKPVTAATRVLLEILQEQSSKLVGIGRQIP